MTRGRVSHDYALFVLLAVALTHAAGYAFILIPPWQAPDEPGHYVYVQELAQYGFSVPAAERRAAIRQEILKALERAHFWACLRPKSRPATAGFVALPAIQVQWDMSAAVATSASQRIFIEDVYLSDQRSDEPALYYLPPAGLTRWLAGVTQPLYLARAWSVCLFGITIILIYAGLRELTPADWFTPVVGGGLVALMPMPAFIGGICNNDIAAMAASSAVLWWLLRGTRRGWTLIRWIGLAGLLLVATFTKKTTLFLWPLAGATLFVYWLRQQREKGRYTSRPMIYGWCGLGLMALALAVLIGHYPVDEAAGWRVAGGRRLASRLPDVGYTGAYAFRLEPATNGDQSRLEQEIPYRTLADAMRGDVHLTLWAKGEGQPAAGSLVILDGKTLTRLSFHVQPDEWSRVTLPHPIASQATRLHVVVINAGATAMLLDDLSLRDEQGVELLRNGGAEEAARLGERWLEASGLFGSGLAPHLTNVNSYDRQSLMRYALYIALTFASFWANFGWLTIPLAPAWYIVPALACGAAVWGVVRAIRRRKTSLSAGWLIAGLAVGLIMGQTFIPMIGVTWQPQGRYLFPALLPIAGLLARGWRELAPAPARPLWAGYLLIGVFAFGQLCIWGYLIPHYSQCG